jgi:hypothetical protein
MAMSNKTRATLPNGLTMGQMPMQLCQPFNDIQLLAMLAAQMPGLNMEERIAEAVDIVARAALANMGGAIPKRVAELQAEARARVAAEEDLIRLEREEKRSQLELP